MICPYNKFKEMECEKCAAYEADTAKVLGFEYDGESLKTIMKSTCKLVQHGAAVPSDVHVSYEGIHFHPNKLEQWHQLAEDDSK